ncbi:DUF6086 family protein [Streptosporangium sp. NPDC051022]|uniref:DUF6086 family protein n=1 Tax=Streptosporangium sp. NPDC051022 TaxID=3155752 RepID=UPI00341E0655
MSYIFDAGEETVWSPALRVGKVYLSLRRSTSDLLGLPTGVVEVSGDICEIDVEVFESLTRRMFEEYFVSSHVVYRDLMGGVLSASAVMLERSGGALTASSAEEREFLDRACLMGKSMLA